MEEIDNELEDLDKIEPTDFNTYWKTLYLYGKFFSIVLFKDLNDNIPVGSILSTYRCYEVKGIDGDLSTVKRRCNFDNDLKNFPLSEGDVINIRTEMDRNVKWSYLFTFLIELDPL